MLTYNNSVKIHNKFKEINCNKKTVDIKNKKNI